MNKRLLLQGGISLLILVIIGIIVFAAVSYRVNNGVNTTINEWSECWDVDNAAGVDLFVPTNTAAEWTAFRTNKPTGVTLTTPGCDPGQNCGNDPCGVSCGTCSTGWTCGTCFPGQCQDDSQACI